MHDIYKIHAAFQTLMETCKNLLNHDIHVHLKNLTTAATKGYVPKGDNCSLCSKQYINQNETDTVVIFRSADCVNSKQCLIPPSAVCCTMYIFVNMGLHASFMTKNFRKEFLPLQFLSILESLKSYLYMYHHVIE